MKIGIVGSEENRWTPKTRAKAKVLIYRLLKDAKSAYYFLHSAGIIHQEFHVVSGGCPKGGVDIWTEEIAKELGIPEKDIIVHKPETEGWEDEWVQQANGPFKLPKMGFKSRNALIARDSDPLHIIVPAKYPDGYTGKRFKLCYHCDTDSHIPSGACWTGKHALKIDSTKKVVWHIIAEEGSAIEVEEE